MFVVLQPKYITLVWIALKIHVNSKNDKYKRMGLGMRVHVEFALPLKCYLLVSGAFISMQMRYSVRNCRHSRHI